ncbi:fructuronate reductase, partial [Serratia marcescens]|nr:fructuronate reductase [Serratia marcescens]
QPRPLRLRDAVRGQRRPGGDYRGRARGVAGWMRYGGGVDDAGEPIDIRDPLADVLKQTIAATPDDRRRVAALLALKSVFGEALAAHAAFTEAVTQAYLSLRDRGARETVKEWVMR